MIAAVSPKCARATGDVRIREPLPALRPVGDLRHPRLAAVRAYSLEISSAAHIGPRCSERRRAAMARSPASLTAKRR